MNLARTRDEEYEEHFSQKTLREENLWQMEGLYLCSEQISQQRTTLIQLA
jgi:hypothetical protein